MASVEMSEFVYAVHIRTTCEKLWDALTDPGFTSRYFFGCRIESDFKVGSSIRYLNADGSDNVEGKILECDPPKLLSFTWLVMVNEETKAQGASRVTFDLLPMGETVRLTLTHDRLLPEQLHKDYPGKHAFYGFRNGWPAIISSLKSLLETGDALKYQF